MAERPVAHRIQATVASFRTWRISRDRYCTGLSRRQLNVGSRRGQGKQPLAAVPQSFFFIATVEALLAKRHNENVEILSYANHQIEVRRRVRQKRLGVTVYPNGRICVSANKSLTQREIVKFLSTQHQWLEKSLAEARKNREKYPVKKFSTGEFFSFVGKDYQLKIQQGSQVGLQFSDDFMILTTKVAESNWSPALREKYFQSFKKSYRQVASQIMTRRVQHWSHMMKLYPTGLQFRGQKTIWGSCSPENKISLNFKLVVAPLEVIDYVIIHELAHIKHKNHSKSFWNLVEKYTTYRQFSRDWLRENQYACDFLNKKSELV